jgi:hypothetical protein
MKFSLGASWSTPMGMWLKPEIELDSADFDSIVSEYGLFDPRLDSVYHRGKVLEAYANIMIIEFLVAHGAATKEEAASRVNSQKSVIKSYARYQEESSGDNVRSQQ